MVSANNNNIAASKRFGLYAEKPKTIASKQPCAALIKKTIVQVLKEGSCMNRLVTWKPCKNKMLLFELLWNAAEERVNFIGITRLYSDWKEFAVVFNLNAINT